MMRFLPIITQISTWKSVKIQQWIMGKDNQYKSWIYKLYNSTYFAILYKEYKRKNLKISFHLVSWILMSNINWL